MEAPKPKKLVSVEVSSGIMFIDAEGEGREWISTNARQFGPLYKDQADQSSWTLFPRKTFDFNEIKAYLENMGQDMLSETEPAVNVDGSIPSVEVATQRVVMMYVEAEAKAADGDELGHILSDDLQ